MNSVYPDSHQAHQYAHHPSLIISLLPFQQQRLERLQADGFGSGFKAIGFLASVNDVGFVRGDVFRGGIETGGEHGGEAAFDLDGPGFSGAEFQDQIDEWG